MKNKIFIGISIALIVSIFVNIALGFNVSSKNQKSEEYQTLNKELHKQIKSLEIKINKAEGKLIDEQLVEDSEAKEVVKNFFKTQYEFTSESYKERFEKIKEFVSDNVYGQLTTAGIPDTPKVKFKNQITNLKIYLTAENKELTGLVLLDTIYEIEGVKSPETTQIFQVTVGKEKGKQKIIALESLGTFASMTES